jgi:hypothetical protein
MATQSSVQIDSPRAVTPAHSLAPVPKVAASGIAGAIATIAVWGLQQLLGITLPPDVVAAMTTLVMFGVGYMVKSGEAAPTA